MEKKVFQEMLEAQLEALDVQLNLLEARLQIAYPDLPLEHALCLDALCVKADEAEAKLDEVRVRSTDAWQDLQEDIERRLGELSEAVSEVMERFNKAGSRRERYAFSRRAINVINAGH